jgi:hypothetical protein
MSRDHHTVSGKIKATIPFVVQRIVDPDISSGMRSKLIRGCHRQVGVAGIPKDSKMLIHR